MGQGSQREIGGLAKRLSAGGWFGLHELFCAMHTLQRDAWEATALAHQGQAGIHVFPGFFEPDVIGIFGD